MKATLEEISPVKQKLLIEIESQEVQRKFNLTYNQFNKRAKIPGFRAGKVPRKILERHFGAQVKEDVTRDLINETFPKALQEVETFPLGTPILEKETLKEGQDFRYSAIMEVRPRFEIKDYLGMEVKKDVYEVTDQDVQDRLEEIRKARGNLTSISKDRAIKQDDYAILDYEGFEDDRPLEGAKSPNFLLRVGSGDFHPELEKALIGLKKEAETEITVNFEDNYYHRKIAGKKVTFRVRVKDIKEMILPELDNEFAKGLGDDFKDLKDLKNKLKETLTSEGEKKSDQEVKRRLIEAISDGIEFELPEVLVKSELNYAVENVRQSLKRSGSDLEKAGLSEEKLRKDYRPASEKRVKEMLILSEIAKQENISVDENDLTEGFEELASSTGQDAEAMMSFYEARGLMDSMKQRLLEEKTLNYLRGHAKIIEVNSTQKQSDSEEEKT